MTVLSPIRLSIAAPAYNESAGLRAVVIAWQHYLRQQTDVTEFEIVICNDGSSDDTGAILNELALHHAEIHPIHFKINQGAAAALAAAIAATRYDWVLLLDSDDQFPIENFSLLFAALKQADVSAVQGVRDKQDNVIARFGTKISGFICNLIHRSKLRDFNTACKLVDGKLLRSLVLEAKGMNYSTEITSRLLEREATIVEVDIIHRQRNIGKSNMKLIKDSLHRLLFVCYLLMRQFLLRFGILKRPDVKVP
jgi:dolichol-phosphate mannosyltransferase